MKQVDFDQITIQHFRSFRAAPATLRLQYPEPGLTYIGGRNDLDPALGANDAGKSTLYDAFMWCLYGRTVRNLRNPDIKPWDCEHASTEVVVKLRVNDNPNKITRRAVSNGLMLNADVVTQDHVDALIGIPFELASHAILFGQGRSLFFDLAPTKKLSLIGDALNVDRWEARAANAKKAAEDLQGVILHKEGKLSSGESALEQLKQLLKEAKTRAEAWETEVRARARDTRKELAELRRQLSGLEKQRDDADLTYDGAMTELKAMGKETEELQKLADKVTTNYRRAELQIEALKRTRANLTDRCPTCGQLIKGADVAKHKAEIDKQIEAGIPIKIKNALTAVEGRIQTATKYANNFRAKADAARETLLRLSPITAALETKIIALNDQHHARERDENPHRAEAESLRHRVRKLDEQLDVLNRDIVKHSRLEQRSKFWAKEFKLVRLDIIEDVLDDLELATNALLPESGLDGWQVKFQVEKETKSGTTIRGLNILTYSPHHSEPVRWESWGGGVAQRLRIVGALALAEVLLNHAGIQTNLVILDEPTRGLSSEGVQDLCEFLAARAQALEQDIFLTDHMVIESASFSRSLLVVKDRNGSRLEKQ